MYDMIIITVGTTASITFFATLKLGLIKLLKKPVGRMAKTSCFARRVNAAPVLVLNSHRKLPPNCREFRVD